MTRFVFCMDVLGHSEDIARDKLLLKIVKVFFAQIVTFLHLLTKSYKLSFGQFYH